VEIELEASNQVEVPSRKPSMRVLVIAMAVMCVVAASAVPILVSKLSTNSTVQIPVPDSTSTFKPVGYEVDTAAPSVNDCWKSIDFQLLRSEDYYRSGKEIDCKKNHDSITFHVGSLPQATELNYGDAYSLSGYPSNREAKDQAISICRDAFSSEFGSTTSRLGLMFFIPDPYAWAAGARWVRCDVYEVELGSAVGSEVAALVTSDLEATRNHFYNNDYQICLTVGASQVPFDEDSIYADCGGYYDFKLVAEQDMSSYGSEYPGQMVVDTESQRFCAAAGSNLRGYYPTESGWAQGNTFIRCWQANF
jgi:hypothetical protein